MRRSLEHCGVAAVVPAGVLSLGLSRFDLADLSGGTAANLWIAFGVILAVCVLLLGFAVRVFRRDFRK